MKKSEDKSDDLTLIVTNLEPDTKEVAGEVLDVDAEEAASVEDDVPVAVTEDEAAETATTKAQGKSKRSAWKILSNEDLPAVSLREILGGDYLIGSFLRHNILFILMLVLMGIVYISNRYGAQQEIIEEVNLRKELQEKRSYAQTQYAKLTMQTRQSALEQRLKNLGDSTLLAAKEPPFIIIK
ncbi:MAG: hypothetical protein J5545_08290 [Bacteroidaceae bacterium]|nr:hypothetical protein [Bacteroidaceae bacterium]